MHVVHMHILFYIIKIDNEIEYENLTEHQWYSILVFYLLQEIVQFIYHQKG